MEEEEGAVGHLVLPPWEVDEEGMGDTIAVLCYT